MRIIEAVPGADERVVVISSPDDPSQDRIAAEVGVPAALQTLGAGFGVFLPVPTALLKRCICHSSLQVG